MNAKQIDIVSKLLLNRTEYLNSLPPEKAKGVAIDYLISLGVLDKDGNEISFNQEEFDQSQHPINFRKMCYGN